MKKGISLLDAIVFAIVFFVSTFFIFRLVPQVSKLFSQYFPSLFPQKPLSLIEKAALCAYYRCEKGCASEETEDVCGDWYKDVCNCGNKEGQIPCTEPGNRVCNWLAVEYPVIIDLSGKSVKNRSIIKDVSGLSACLLSSPGQVKVKEEYISSEKITETSLGSIIILIPTSGLAGCRESVVIKEGKYELIARGGYFISTSFIEADYPSGPTIWPWQVFVELSNGTEEKCYDNKDNDLDDKIDCEDSDCWGKQRFYGEEVCCNEDEHCNKKVETDFGYNEFVKGKILEYSGCNKEYHNCTIKNSYIDYCEDESHLIEYVLEDNDMECYKVTCLCEDGECMFEYSYLPEKVKIECPTKQTEESFTQPTEEGTQQTTEEQTQQPQEVKEEKTTQPSETQPPLKKPEGWFDRIIGGVNWIGDMITKGLGNLINNLIRSRFPK